MPREIKNIVPGLHFGEGPRWHAGRLWFSDMYAPTVSSCLEDGSDLRVEATVPGQPSGLGWLPDGRLLIVSMTDRRILRREGNDSSAPLVLHADLAGHIGNGHANDMVVDGAGRAYVGGFGFDLLGPEGLGGLVPSRLVKVDPDGSVSVQSDNLFFPNGCVIAGAGDSKADAGAGGDVQGVGGTFIVDESYGNRISAFDIDPVDGSLSNHRTWARFGPPPEQGADGKWAVKEFGAIVDGCCLDAEGMIWAADVAQGRLIRVKEGGEIVESIDAGMGAYACMLGGEDGKTLFAVLTPTHVVADCKASKAGNISAIRVDVGRAGRP